MKIYRMSDSIRIMLALHKCPFNFQSAILSWVLGLAPWMMQNDYVVSGIICIQLRETLLGFHCFMKKPFPDSFAPENDVSLGGSITHPPRKI